MGQNQVCFTERWASFGMAIFLSFHCIHIILNIILTERYIEREKK